MSKVFNRVDAFFTSNNFFMRLSTEKKRSLLQYENTMDSDVFSKSRENWGKYHRSLFFFFSTKDNISYDESMDSSVKSVHLKWLHSSINILSLSMSTKIIIICINTLTVMTNNSEV